MSESRILTLVVLFAGQAVWAAAVLYGVFAVLPFFLLQLWVFARTPALHIGIPKYVAIVVVGLLVDFTMEFAGLVSFRNDSAFAFPAWLVLLWVSFALTVLPLLNLCKTIWQTMLLFCVGGTLAYVGGAKLGAATIQQPEAYWTILATLWLFYPLLWRKMMPHGELRHER